MSHGQQDLERARLLTLRGIDAAKNGDLVGALHFYDEAILAADHLPALMNRACAYYHLGDFERAVRDSSWALEVDAGKSHMWLLRGMARARKGDLVQADEDLTRSLSMELKRSDQLVAKKMLARVRKASREGKVSRSA